MYDTDINQYSKRPKMIAEIGCNHKGDIDIAYEMIKTAAIFCKVDAVKFQKRTNKELLTKEEYNAPHPELYHAYGATYGEHREFLEFDLEQHSMLQDWCNELNIEYNCSVWDLTAAKQIASLKPKCIKIPSASNLDFTMMRWLCDHYDGDIHVSLGMTTREEEDQIVDLFIRNYRNDSLVLYSCTSGYPVPFEDICLLEIKRISQRFDPLVKAIGFSGHHLGIGADIAALALGADYFERHYTIDRTWRGTDHAASLEPDGLRRLTRNLRQVSASLCYKPIEILDIEKKQRAKLKRFVKPQKKTSSMFN